MYQKSWSYTLLILRYGMWQMELLLLIWGYFLSFYPPNSLKSENFKKMKKNPGDIIILHMCNKNYDSMMYDSWDVVWDRQTDRQKKWHKEVGAPPQKWGLAYNKYFWKWINFKTHIDTKYLLLCLKCAILLIL